MTKNKKRAVIFGVDGVVSDCSERIQYLLSDKTRFHAEFLKDKPVTNVATIIQALLWYRHMKDHDLEILFSTDRPPYMRDISAEWLAENVHIHNAKVYTRDRKSMTMDTVSVKKHNLEIIKRDYDVVMAFDSCPEACDMYTANGVPCMQLREEKSDAAKP